VPGPLAGDQVGTARAGHPNPYDVAIARPLAGLSSVEGAQPRYGVTGSLGRPMAEGHRLIRARNARTVKARSTGPARRRTKSRTVPAPPAATFATRPRPDSASPDQGVPQRCRRAIPIDLMGRPAHTRRIRRDRQPSDSLLQSFSTHVGPYLVYRTHWRRCTYNQFADIHYLDPADHRGS
jgi:hypothetical protein